MLKSHDGIKQFSQANLFDQFTQTALLLIKVVTMMLSFLESSSEEHDVIKQVIVSASVLSVHLFKLIKLDSECIAACCGIFHTFLGKRRLCSLMDGIAQVYAGKFLHAITPHTDTRDLYQCFYCLYGVYIKVDNDVYIDDHHAVHFPFNKDAAIQAFESVQEYVMTRLHSRAHRGISPDIKSCLDKILQVFTIDWGNGLIIFYSSSFDSQ